MGEPIWTNVRMLLPFDPADTWPGSDPVRDVLDELIEAVSEGEHEVEESRRDRGDGYWLWHISGHFNYGLARISHLFPVLQEAGAAYWASDDPWAEGCGTWERWCPMHGANSGSCEEGGVPTIDAITVKAIHNWSKMGTNLVALFGGETSADTATAWQTTAILTNLDLGDDRTPICPSGHHITTRFFREVAP